MIRTHRPFWDGHRQARVKTAARCCGATALNTITFVQPKFRVRISPFFFFYPFGENVSFVNANKTTKTILICFKTDWVISFPYLEIWSTSAWQPNIDSRFGLTSGAGGSRKWNFRCRCAEYQNGKSWENRWERGNSRQFVERCSLLHLTCLFALVRRVRESPAASRNTLSTGEE